MGAKETIMNRVNIDEETGCWEWSLYRNKDGYGKITYKKKLYSAHRLSYSVFNGAIPSGLCVCHSCDNRGCANPDHLFLGTQKQNIIDMDKKGRRRGYAYGEDHPNSKLSDLQVSEIVSMLSSGCAGPTELSRKYGVSTTHIHRIKNGHCRNMGVPVV